MNNEFNTAWDPEGFFDVKQDTTIDTYYLPYQKK
jgi:hypothetical protein